MSQLFKHCSVQDVTSVKDSFFRVDRCIGPIRLQDAPVPVVPVKVTYSLSSLAAPVVKVKDEVGSPDFRDKFIEVHVPAETVQEPVNVDGMDVGWKSADVDHVWGSGTIKQGGIEVQ